MIGHVSRHGGLLREIVEGRNGGKPTRWIRRIQTLYMILVNDISYAALERLAENKAGWKHKEKGCRESAGQQKSTRRRKDGFYAYVDGHSSTRRISTSVAAAGPVRCPFNVFDASREYFTRPANRTRWVVRGRRRHSRTAGVGERRRHPISGAGVPTDRSRVDTTIRPS